MCKRFHEKLVMINISTIVRALCQNVMWRTTYTHLVDLAPPTLVPLEPCNMLLPFTSQETVRIKNSIVVHTGTSVHSGTLDRESGKHATYEALRKCVDAGKLTDRTTLLPRMTNEGKTSRMIISATRPRSRNRDRPKCKCLRNINLLHARFIK